jgi:hypothetical protein
MMPGTLNKPAAPAFETARAAMVAALLLALVVVLANSPEAQAAPGDGAQNTLSYCSYMIERDKTQLKALAARAVRGGVPGESLDRLTLVAMTRRTAPRALAHYYQVLMRVAAQGLPVSVFENKIEEGLAKNAPPDLILSVITRKEQSYLQARALLVRNLPKQQLSSSSYPQVLNLVSDALQRGTPPFTVEAILASKAGTIEERGRAVLAYGQLISIGFPAPEGRDIVLAALKNGYYRDCMGCVGQLVVGASRRGLPSAQIRDQLVSAMSQRRNLQEVGYTIFTSTDR